MSHSFLTFFHGPFIQYIKHSLIINYKYYKDINAKLCFFIE